MQFNKKNHFLCRNIVDKLSYTKRKRLFWTWNFEWCFISNWSNQCV